MTEMNTENDPVGSSTEPLKAKAAGMAQAAKDRARSEAETGKASAAGKIDQFASAIDHASGELSDSPTLSHYATELSGSMHGLAERLRSRSIDDLAEDARSLARRNPTVFVAGSIAIGLLATRFLKARGRAKQEATDGLDADAALEPDTMADRDPPLQGVH